MLVYQDTGVSWNFLSPTYNAADQTYSFSLGSGTFEVWFLWPSTAAGGGTTTGQIACPGGTALSSPYPQNSAGEYLRVACYTITGPGARTISLTQVLADAGANVGTDSKTTIQANPAAMQVWRMGSWFLMSTSYNPATQTYTFDTITGAHIYVFFYPPITRRVGAQGYSVVTSAGTTTGDVEALPIAVEEQPRTAMAASGILLLMGGLYAVNRRKPLAE
jgi:hypothetical protein